MSEVSELTPQSTKVHPFVDLLTPESLSALMRSTWTWDDRALRRDLAALLVDLSAGRGSGCGKVATVDDVVAIAKLLRCQQ